MKQGIRTIQVLALGVLLLASFDLHAEGLLSSNQMLLIDGKPSFVLGLYQNPKEDAALQAAARAGFNLIQSTPDMAELDRLQKAGVRAWINIGMNLDLSTNAETRKVALLQAVNQFKDHPALLLWEGPDEVLWNEGAESGASYFQATEFPAMEKAVKESSPESREELSRLSSRCRELFDRALWAQFDAARAEFWKQVGAEPPRSGYTMASRQAITNALGEGLALGMETVHAVDPKHAIWLNHAPRNSLASLALFNRNVDMAGCDIYPVPPEIGHSDLGTSWITSVGLYTDRMRKAAPGKACAMVLQGFGWRDIAAQQPKEAAPGTLPSGRRPTLEESRFMAFNSIVHGANAILYWGTAYVEKDSAFWKDLLRITREIRALEPALVVPSEQGVTVVSDENPASVDGNGVAAVCKKVGKDYVIIAVNEANVGLSFSVKGLPAEMENKELYRLGTGEKVVVKNGQMRDGIRRFDVHVYATTRAYEPAKQP
ncbi:MAG: hypothetical protein WC869_10645 [Phycisphaerae bacterium]|jgi:hypothetical protein